jgi:hypothetical protein
MEANLKLYHCNDATRCDRFLSDMAYYINSKEDGIWLGSGMYFWDNISNAIYWRDIKIRKNRSLQYKIVSAHVILNKLLDLTDKQVCISMNLLWRTYQNTIRDYKEVELGKRINILFDYFHEFLALEYDVIKVYGYYKEDSENKFISYDPSIKRPQPRLDTKCIYNVKNINCISNRNEVNNI